MSADLKLDEAQMNTTNDNQNNDGNRGLIYEENLLWEKERSDTPGV